MGLGIPPTRLFKLTALSAKKSILEEYIMRVPAVLCKLMGDKNHYNHLLLKTATRGIKHTSAVLVHDSTPVEKKKKASRVEREVSVSGRLTLL